MIMKGDWTGLDEIQKKHDKVLMLNSHIILVFTQCFPVVLFD